MKKLINLNLKGVTRGTPLMKQYRNLFIILTVALFLTACGGGGTNSLIGPSNDAVVTDTGDKPESTDGTASTSQGNDGDGDTTMVGNNDDTSQNNGGDGGNTMVASNGGIPQDNNPGGSPQSNNDGNTGSSSQGNNGGSTGGTPPQSNNGGNNSEGSPQDNNDGNNPGGSPQDNNDNNIGVSNNNDGPLTAQEETAAARAKAAAEAAEGRIAQAAEGALTNFYQKRTLSKAMGVSRNTGAGDAVRAVSTIEREIAAVRRHLTTATNSATTLRTRADRLREAEAEHEMRLEAADDPKAAGNIHDLQKMLAEAEDAARDVESAIAAVDYYVNEKERGAQAADERAALLEAGGPECDFRCPGPGNPPNLDGAQSEDGRFYRPGAKASRQEAANLRKDAREYKALPIDYDGTEYTYSRLKSIAATKRRTADAEKRKVDAKQAEIDRLSERLIQAEKDTQSAEEAAATAEDQAGEIEAILKPLEDSLEVWKGVVAGGASALESEKARLVLDLLREFEGNPGPAAPTDAISDLDTADYVFARASNKPARTMTFEDIATANAEWVLHRRTFVDGTNVDTNAHSNTGLPRNHPAIALSGLDTTVFVQQDGTSPSYPYTPNTPNDGRYAPFGFHHGKLNGIDGTLYCDRDGGCGTYTKSGTTEFLDGWYFTPAVNSSRQASLGYSPIETAYEDSDNDGTYEVVRYVEYGMWLTGFDEGTKRVVNRETVDSRLTLHRRIGLVGPSNSRNLDFGTNTALDPSATYSGDAHGLSARTRGTGNNATTASGHFTADVELNVTFGGTPLTEIRGTIDNFRPVSGQGSDHVDRRWSVSLYSPVPLVIPNDGRVGGDVTITAPNGDGDWGWTAYGEFQERPAGFYGDFDVEFYDDNTDDTNGAAAGLYHVEKQ